MQVLFRDVKLPYEIKLQKLKDQTIPLMVTEVNAFAGFTSIIETYYDEEFAIKKAERFARNIELAIESNYRLLGSIRLVHPSGKQIHVSHALDTDSSEQEFKILLETGER